MLMGGRGVFLGSVMPHPDGTGLSVAQIFGTPTYTNISIKFGMVSCGGGDAFLESQPCPIIRGRDPSIPNFWDLLHVHTQCEKQ